MLVGKLIQIVRQVRQVHLNIKAGMLEGKLIQIIGLLS